MILLYLNFVEESGRREVILDMSNHSRISDILKKGAMISGAVARGVIGIGAAALAFLAFKKKKPKK